MHMFDVLHQKRCGGELTDADIRAVVRGYTDGEIPDYQMAALAMAICCRGMSARETATLTDAMARSGDTVDLSRFGTLSVDKHSTGGVGDKTTLIVAPLVAALGGKVAKMSGRGLGHTGGTVDKLEAIPGYRTTLSAAAFMEQVERVGVAVIGQSGNLAPADKKLYALRDVTATVDSIPLIVSSIMSKKLAAGSHSIVLDVKVGSGAFMKTPQDAATLARHMVDIGRACGRQVTALLTDMDRPLGCAVGNALEVKEAVAVLRGAGRDGALRDLRTVCVALAGEMLALCRGESPDVCRAAAERALDDRTALRKFREWITAQGGDDHFVDDPAALPDAPFSRVVTADKDGFVTHMDTEAIGGAAVLLGAGRERREDAIDPAAGLLLGAKTGDRVTAGKPLVTLFASDETRLSDAAAAFRHAVTIADAPPAPTPLIHDILR